MKTSTILNVLVSLTLTTSRVSSSPVDAADGMWSPPPPSPFLEGGKNSVLLISHLCV